MAAFAEVGVVHLVRKANGPEVFGKFIRSFRNVPPGIPADLILIFKGFAEDDDLAAYQQLIGSQEHRKVFLPDEGYDLGAYFAVLPALGNPFLCFLNSFCEIVADCWLGKLHAAARRPGVGVVGASGSYEAHPSNLVTALITVRRARFGLRWQALRHIVAGGLNLARFPNPHVRTNAFLIARSILTSLALPAIRTKQDCNFFESGPWSLTRQLKARGLAPVVVGADGQVFQVDCWPESHTFRHGEQENLLVRDNQTEMYRTGSNALRDKLIDLAWKGQDLKVSRSAYLEAALEVRRPG